MRALGGSAAFVMGAALVLVLASSCSSSSGGGGDACSQYYDSLVSYQQRCGTQTDPAQAEAGRQRFLIACANAVNAPGASNFASAISGCATQIAGASCADSTSCELDSKGTLADGAACQSGSQCASGGCDADDNQCGHCVPLAAVGQPCDSKTKCVKDAICSYTTGGTGTCQAQIKAKAGQDCKATGTTYITCDTNLSCVYAADNKTATCQPRGAAGTPCTNSGDCQRDLVCNNKVCDKGVAVGGDCTNGNGPACTRGLVCPQATKKCAAVSYVAGGQACDETRKCSKGRCKRTTIDDTSAAGTCEDPLPDGATCLKSTTTETPQCDRYAECINGTCQIPNPATCQ